MIRLLKDTECIKMLLVEWQKQMKASFSFLYGHIGQIIA